MTIHISLTPEIEIKLKAKAEAAGVDLETLAARTLEQFAVRPALDDMLAPLRADVEASGMSEEALAELLETAKHQMRAVVVT